MHERSAASQRSAGRRRYAALARTSRHRPQPVSVRQGGIRAAAGPFCPRTRGLQPAELLEVLVSEANALLACASSVRDTTLLIAPHIFPAFIEFHEFTQRAERRLARAGCEGVLQLPAFIREFQFAGSTPQDIENATNRAPYPTLHLLREDSVSRAVAAFPEAEKIFERNIRTMQGLGREGWAALAVGAGAAQADKPSDAIMRPYHSTCRAGSAAGHGTKQRRSTKRMPRPTRCSGNCARANRLSC